MTLPTKQGNGRVPEKLFLTHWHEWYLEQKPELFDPASFDIFIRSNAPKLVGSGAIVFIRGDHYVVSPDFDRYVVMEINRGLIKALLRSRRPLPVGAQ